MKKAAVLLCVVLLAVGLFTAQPISIGHAAPRFTDYETLHFAILDLTAGPENPAQFAALSAPAQALFIAAIYEMQVTNDGLLLFFSNCGVDYAERVAGGLRTVGLPQFADQYERFLSDHQITDDDILHFSANHYGTPEGNKKLIALLERYPFDAFDDEFASNREAFLTAMLAYANAHSEVFQSP